MDTLEFVKMGTLISLYGPLLTEKQLEILNYYYSDNYSLTEIADIAGISKQAVQDMMKKGESKLFEIEEKLQLMKRNQTNEAQIQLVLELLGKIDENSSEKEISKIIEQVRIELSSII